MIEACWTAGLMHRPEDEAPASAATRFLEMVGYKLNCVVMSRSTEAQLSFRQPKCHDCWRMTFDLTEKMDWTYEIQAYHRRLARCMRMPSRDQRFLETGKEHRFHENPNRTESWGWVSVALCVGHPLAQGKGNPGTCFAQPQVSPSPYYGPSSPSKKAYMRAVLFSVPMPTIKWHR
jgi:hypothetical protein